VKFPVDDLYELVRGGEVDNLELIEDEFVGTSRWTNNHRMILKHDDKYYAVDYQQGATEYQDVDMFDDRDGTVEATEVEPVEVTTTVYKNKRTESRAPKTA
jgi:hypothetical protein